MSNTTTNVLALVALIFLWGLAGHFDEVDDASFDSSDPAQTTVATKGPAAPPLLRLVCIAEKDPAPITPSTGHRTGQPQLVSFSVQPDGEGHASAAVLRCFVDND